MAYVKTGLHSLKLTNFRSYGYLDMTLDSSFLPVVLTGHNGAGKTNILEAVSFLTAGKGLRAARLSDVARRSNPEALLNADIIQLPERWSVFAHVQTKDGVTQIGTGTIDGSERRQIRIDGKNITKQSELGRILRCLWLTPAQDRLFCGDPQARRRFLDRLVQAFDATHAARLSDYNTAFKQWSCLLREGRFDDRWLTGLEAQLAGVGVAIAASRIDVINRIGHYLAHPLDKSFPAPDVVLTGVVEQSLLQKSALEAEELFAAQLKKQRKIYADGGSVAGPHTADFKVIHMQKGMDAALCSTGEQKALLLSIILAEMKTQLQEQGDCPLLLLDEVAAHMDSHRRHILYDILSELPTQVWMTGTDIENFTYLSNRAQFFDVQDSNLNSQNVA